MQTFKRAAVFTDIHFGNKGNSRQFNQDCDRFIDWFIEDAQAKGCETFIFMGDWHHHRANINIDTLGYSLKGLEKLAKAFEKTYFLLGNHDLYFKDSRVVNSVEWAKNIPNVEIIHEPYYTEDCAFIPWLVGEEWKELKEAKSMPYVFGHFELPHFLMNAMVSMPDTNELRAEHLQHHDYVFSGHFHKRQVKSNIHYIGNSFPHNYSDANDFARGWMELEHGGDPIYHDWADCPKYQTASLSELLHNSSILKNNAYVRVDIDTDITYEDSNFVKDTFMRQYKLREMTFIQQRDMTQYDSTEVPQAFESIDEIVHNQIMAVDSDHYDSNLLLEIYKNL